MGGTGDAPQGVSPPAFALHYATRTVVFADVVESVRLMQRDELTVAQRIRTLLLQASNEIVPRNRGSVLQRLGDGLMLDFAHPRHAAECAAGAASSVRRAVGQATGRRSRADAHGYPCRRYPDRRRCNLRPRRERRSAPAARCRTGETVISAAARDQLTAGLDGEIEDLGSCHLKNIEAPLRTYRLGPHNAQPPAPETSDQAAARRWP